MLLFHFFLFVSCADWIQLRENVEGSSFGTKGSFDDSNNPPIRGNAAFWYYNANNSIWFFGGHKTLIQQYNDIWEYSIDRNQYRFVAGSETINNEGYDGNYATLNTYSKSFIPFSRYLPGSFTSANGTFILLGGAYFDLTDSYTFNDIWEFNPLNEEWRILRKFDEASGKITVYGHNGTFDSLNLPNVYMGIRFTKRTDDIYIMFYGGQSILDYWSELWEYSYSLNSFRFTHGDPTLTNDDSEELLNGRIPGKGKCGNISVSLPPSRILYNSWFYKGKYWLFGGLRYRTGIGKELSDFWTIELDNSTFGEREWCYIGGALGEDRDPVYNEKNFGSDYYPGSKGCSVYFSQEYDYNGIVDQPFFVVWGGSINGVNDGWVYNPLTYEWKFCMGDAITPQDHAGYPDRRSSPVFVTPTNEPNTVIMMGGLYNTDSGPTAGLTDVWKYTRREFTCFGIDSDDSSVCNDGKGICTSPGKNLTAEGPYYPEGICECTDIYYEGDECTIFLEGKYFMRNVFPFLATFGSIGVVLGCICCCCLFLLILVIIGSSPAWLLGVRKGLGIARDVSLLKKIDHIDMVLQEQSMMKKSAAGETPSFLIDKNLFEIDAKSIQLIKAVAEGGGGGVIYKGEWKSRIICYKCFKTRSLSDKESFEEFEREVHIISSVSHPHLVQFFGCTLVSPRIGIVLEWCDEGDLQAYMLLGLKGKKPVLDGEDKIRILHEIAIGMDYLHDRNIIHRDLKTNNVLLNSNLTAKIADFGLSRIVKGGDSSSGSHMTKNIGTSLFMAPEVVTGSGNYSNKVDVFSMSIIMFEVFFEDFDPYKLKKKQRCIELKVANSPNFRPIIPETMLWDQQKYGWLVKLIMKSWAHFPDERPSFNDIRLTFEKNMVTKQSKRKMNEEKDDRYEDVDLI